jgi:hypothetical protein
MGVTTSLVQHEASRVAASGHSASQQRQDISGHARLIAALDTDQPGFSIPPGCSNGKITSKVHDATALCIRGKQVTDSHVDGIFLADAAKIDLHAGLKRKQWPVPGRAMPTYLLHQFGDLRPIRYATAAIEVPGTP